MKKKKAAAALNKSKRKLMIIGAVIATLIGAVPAFADYIMYSGDLTRTRNIVDGDTPIEYAWDLETGWSVSQPITVTDPKDGQVYAYHIGALPDANNDVQLPRGSYLWKIPLRSEEIRKLPHEQQIDWMIEHGLRAMQLGPYTKTYSHVTWSPENKHFYVGWGTGKASKLISVDANLASMISMPLSDTPIASPTVYANDLVVIGTMDGKLRAVKGLSSGKYVSTSYDYDTAPNAEITGHLTGIPGTKQFGVGLNYRKSSQKGKFNLFEVVDNGSAAPTIRSLWDSYYITNSGVATDAAYDAGVFYFSDKAGTFYAVIANAPGQKWAANHRSQVPSIPTDDVIRTADELMASLPPEELEIMKKLNQRMDNAEDLPTPRTPEQPEMTHLGGRMYSVTNPDGTVEIVIK